MLSNLGGYVERAEFGTAELDAYRAAQSTLARLFGDVEVLVAERRRSADAIFAALSSAADQRQSAL